MITLLCLNLVNNNYNIIYLCKLYIILAEDIKRIYIYISFTDNFGLNRIMTTTNDYKQIIIQ